MTFPPHPSPRLGCCGVGAFSGGSWPQRGKRRWRLQSRPFRSQRFRAAAAAGNNGGCCLRASVPHCLQHGDLPLNYIFILSAILAAYVTSQPSQRSPRISSAKILSLWESRPPDFKTGRLYCFPSFFPSSWVFGPACLIRGRDRAELGAVESSRWELRGFVDEGRSFCMQIWVRVETVAKLRWRLQRGRTLAAFPRSFLGTKRPAKGTSTFCPEVFFPSCVRSPGASRLPHPSLPSDS